MTEAARERALQAFLMQFFADQDRGAVASCDEYERRFPGHENAIRAAWEQITRHPDDVGEESIEGFELLRELGSGGQGLVYLARDKALDRLVALKILGSAHVGAKPQPWTERMRKRFEREAVLASRLQHPGICPVYSMGTHRDRPYLVMPFLTGRTLQEALRDGPLPVERATLIVEDAARALHAAHEAGIVHRDVKSSNLFLTDDGRVVLLDFGIARDVDDDEQLTMTGDVLGTLPFLSPEQVLGKTVDRRSDVYSLAVVLYEALTARLPFDAPTQRGLMNAIVHEDAVDPRRLNRSVPNDLGIVLDMGLEKDVTRRYQSAAEFADELERVRTKQPIRARPAGYVRKIVRFAQRQPKLAASLFGVFAALSLGLVVSLVLLDRVKGEEAKTRLALDEIDLLTDRTRLEELESEIAEFEPPVPTAVPRMQDWLRRADALVDRLALHERVLKELRARADEETNERREAYESRHALADERERLRRSREYLVAEVARLEAETENASASAGLQARLEHRVRELGILDQIQPKIDRAIESGRDWSFARARDRWRHKLQAELVEELTRFRDRTAGGLGRARVRALYDFAREVERRSFIDARDAWDECLATLADRDRAPRYGGLRLSKQLGLVPLGRDPDSGLWEFAHLQSGEVPERDEATGRLRFEEASSLVFVLIPGGTATLGATRPGAERLEGDPHVDPYARQESPVHRVRLDPFFLSKFEVTQAQWVRMMQTNPSSSRIGGKTSLQPPVTGLHPVEGLSWEVARSFCDRYGFELPQSAQWEYAARAGTTTVFSTGDSPKSLEGHANIADRTWGKITGRRDRVYGVFDDGWATHAPVGSFAPNGFGLHDMHGNVMECCFDKEHRYSFHVLPGDGLRPIGGDNGRVLRGGSYRQPWRRARSADFVVQRAKLSVGDCGLRPLRRIGD